MDMPSAFPPGTDVNFPSSSVFGCASSVCFLVSSLFASGVFACGFSVGPCAASFFGCAAKEGSSTDRKSTRLNSSHTVISYAVFCLKKKKNKTHNRLKALRQQRLAVFLLLMRYLV